MTVTQQDLTFREGQNWLIAFAAHDSEGAALPLPSGADVEFRINGVIDNEAVNLLTLSVGNGVVITNPATGLADILVTEADQDSVHIEAGGLYFYEVRVVIGGVPDGQAEGRLNVEESLFSEVVDPLLEQFHARFPEFVENDATILLYIQDAARVVDSTTEWTIENRPTATVYLAAHLLMLRKLAASGYSAATMQGIGGGGPVRTISVEDRTVNFATPNQSTAMTTKAGLAQTIYGQQYLDMLRKAGLGTVVYLQRA